MKFLFASIPPRFLLRLFELLQPLIPRGLLVRDSRIRRKAFQPAHVSYDDQNKKVYIVYTQLMGQLREKKMFVPPLEFL